MGEIERNDLDAWEVEDLSPKFEDRVMAAIEREPIAAVEAPRRSRAPLFIALAAAAVVVTTGALVVPHLRVAHQERGEFYVELHDGARAWPEPGARIDVEDEAVRQTAGTVRYDVPDGVPLVVTTPAGDVIVGGTRFEVEVMEMNEATKKTLMGAGALTMGVIAVGVYVTEGSVTLANDRGEVKVAASQQAYATDASAPVRAGAKKVEAKEKRVVAASPAAQERAKKRAQRDEMLGRIHDALEARHASKSSSSRDEAPAEESEEPGLDKDYIRDVVQEQVVGLVRECYENALEKDANLGGKIVLDFTIAGDESVGGVIEEVLVKDESTLVEPELRECVAESMASATFEPPKGGGSVKVTYPFLFEVADAPEE